MKRDRVWKLGSLDCSAKSGWSAVTYWCSKRSRRTPRGRRKERVVESNSLPVKLPILMPGGPPEIAERIPRVKCRFIACMNWGNTIGVSYFGEAKGHKNAVS